jgi:hypothetical protein
MNQGGSGDERREVRKDVQLQGGTKGKKRHILELGKWNEG